LAERSAAESLLARLPGKSGLTRKSLEERLDQVNRELVEMAKISDEEVARPDIYFGGEPVIGSEAIGTAFAAGALADYQNLVERIYASSVSGQIGERGPVAGRKDSQLFIKGILQGSFGFALEEIPREPSLFGSELRKATEVASEMFADAAAADDEPLLERLGDFDPRVHSALREFLLRVYNAGATFRVVTQDADRHFDADAVRTAALRVQAVQIEERKEWVIGKLGGVLPAARRFELELPNGLVISGKASRDIPEFDLPRWNREFGGRLVRALLNRVTKTKTAGPSVERFTLFELAPVSPQQDQ
jgi:hypothetical protein